MAHANVEAITDRMEKTLERMGGTQCGSDWCIAALDPFHDSELPDLRGFPDGTGMPSLVQVVQQTVTISCPPSITTGTWDAHFVNFPWLNPYSQGYGDFLVPSSTSKQWDPLYLNRGNSTTSGGLYYSSGAPGYNDWFTRTGGTGTALQAATLNPDPRYLSGDYRVIGQAFEVRSIGSNLYKSGLNYMWRQPCANSTSAVTGTCTTAAGSSPVRATMLTVDLPPIDIAAAQLIPSTVRVNASEGGYVVSRFNTINPPIVDNNPVVPIMDTGIIDTIAVAGDASTLHYAIGPLSESLAFTPSTILSATPTRIGSANCGNFDISGSYFTGLNLQDVLNVTVKWIFQRYPSSENPDLVVLASPSPLYDPVAIEAYSRIVGKLPVGCPVRDNSLGDWFKDAASVLTTIAAPILKQVPHPYAQAASNVISSASKALRPTNDVKKVKKPDPGKAVSLKTALQKASKPKKKTK